MLKITIEKNSRSTGLRVEGRLAGPWVDELARSWRTVSLLSSESAVSVDLTDVTFVSEEGKKLLEKMYGEGAKLKASGCVTRRLLEEIEQGLGRSHPRHGVPKPQ